MDFDASVFIITSDKQYIPAVEYDIVLDGKGVFVMITNDELNTEFGDDNSICIHMDWFDAVEKTKDELNHCIKFKNSDEYVSCPWQIEYEEIPSTFKLNRNTDEIGNYDTPERIRCVKKYLDGYRTNQEIMRNVVSLLKGRTIEEYLPAIMVAQHTHVTFDNRIIHGYLPMIGQLRHMSVNLSKINNALKKAGSSQINLNSGQWWSATESGYNIAWSLRYGSMRNTNKNIAFQVLPLFVI